MKFDRSDFQCKVQGLLLAGGRLKLTELGKLKWYLARDCGELEKFKRKRGSSRLQSSVFSLHEHCSSLLDRFGRRSLANGFKMISISISISSNEFLALQHPSWEIRSEDLVVSFCEWPPYEYKPSERVEILHSNNNNNNDRVYWISILRIISKYLSIEASGEGYIKGFIVISLVIEVPYESPCQTYSILRRQEYMPLSLATEKLSYSPEKLGNFTWPRLVEWTDCDVVSSIS